MCNISLPLGWCLQVLQRNIMLNNTLNSSTVSDLCAIEKPFGDTVCTISSPRCYKEEPPFAFEIASVTTADCLPYLAVSNIYLSKSYCYIFPFLLASCVLNYYCLMRCFARCFNYKCRPKRFFSINL